MLQTRERPETLWHTKIWSYCALELINLGIGKLVSQGGHGRVMDPRKVVWWCLRIIRIPYRKDAHRADQTRSRSQTKRE